VSGQQAVNALGAPPTPGDAKRAHDREPDDLKRVLALQALLVERCELELLEVKQ
jgi:hypothetical protein